MRSKGVLNGNWAEERQATASIPVAFEGESVSHSTYGKQARMLLPAGLYYTGVLFIAVFADV